VDRTVAQLSAALDRLGVPAPIAANNGTVTARLNQKEHATA
jgi:hypothetical protein